MVLSESVFVEHLRANWSYDHYPGGYFIGFILNPAPKYEDLSVLQGQIVSARRASPEIVVELASGEKVEMEWPGNYSLIGGIKSNGPLFGDNGVLNGCRAEIKCAPMRFVLGGEHLRIWELRCQSGGVRI